MSECRALILERIRLHGPLTFPEFMELALYHPDAGYYATAARRSGRHGDFYTSVDVGPVFGEFLARQFAEMFRLVDEAGTSDQSPFVLSLSKDERSVRASTGSARTESAPTEKPPLDLVEAGAGNGRLSRDVLDALERIAPHVYERVRLHLVERSASARGEQAATLGRHAPRLASSAPELPGTIQGILFANELLDALPVHVVAGGANGLREIVVDAEGDRLVEREAPPSTPALEAHLASLGIRLQPGWRAEINFGALDWTRRAATAMQRGFVVVIDYGDEAAGLYGPSRALGTLATFTGHVVEVFDQRRPAPWLRSPGDSDITSHVDFTSIRNAAAAGGLEPICLIDQMRFLLGLGVEDWLAHNAGDSREQLARRLALKTLLVPGGLGTTHRVMIFGKDVGRPALGGCG